MNIGQALRPALDKRRSENLYRSRKVVAGPQGPEMVVDGNPMLSFCSNDYLGFAGHPLVIEALQKGATKFGAGSGAAHLVNGHSAAHHALEEELAAFTGRPRALLFSTGYMANLGSITALVSRGDVIYQDRLNHASLVDGGQLSKARFRRFPHADLKRLRRLLNEQQGGRALVAVDGVFSMDGDIAPLDRLSSICGESGAWLMVDDAHGLGVLGEGGGGTLSRFDLGVEQVPVLMGTLGKALGTSGAFVAGSEELIETLIQRARSYIYTTALPPAVAEATRRSLKLLGEESWRRSHLLALIERFRSEVKALGLPLLESDTPIQPIVAGSAMRALKWSKILEKMGILVTAIRAPTVPEGSARLRVTLSAAHTEQHLERLFDGLSLLKTEGEG